MPSRGGGAGAGPGRGPAPQVEAPGRLSPGPGCGGRAEAARCQQPVGPWLTCGGGLEPGVREGPPLAMQDAVSPVP